MSTLTTTTHVATTEFSHHWFARRLAQAWTPRLQENLTDLRDPADIPQGARCYGLIDALGGYAVTPDGELLAFYTLANGTGSTMALQAIVNGAKTLDCFDGYLVDFWSRHGFVEVRREANWTPGGPDVVYMRLSCPEVPCNLGSIHIRGDHQ